MNAIYTGHVAHSRPGKHRLRYSIFMLALDLDTLPALATRLLRHNRASLFSINDSDHAARIDAPLKPQIEEKLRAGGIGWTGGRIVLLTMPRLFNYVFNPLSVYFCWREDGSLAALVHEVSNTFGEQHFYVLPARAEKGVVRQSCDKAFFVSPFLEPDLRYEFSVTPPGERAIVSMIVRRGADIALTASFAGDRRDLTDANLFRAWLANPLMTLKVIAGIHWEAALMMAKGVRYLGRPHGSQAARKQKAAA